MPGARPHDVCAPRSARVVRLGDGGRVRVVLGGASTVVSVNSSGSVLVCVGFSNYGVPIVAAMEMAVCSLGKTFGVFKGE